MGRVRVKIPPFLASMLNPPECGWLVLEREIGKGTTIGEVVAELASSYANFSKVIFNPDVGPVGDQLSIVINDTLLQPQEVTRARLNDGDTIVLLPVYTGG